MESIVECGLANDPLNVMAGIELKDKDGRKYKGPPIYRPNQMTLKEYEKVA